jgi:hypothetical protein
VEVVWRWGTEILLWWRWIWRHRGAVVWLSFTRYRVFDRCEIFWDFQNSPLSLRWFPNLLRFAYLTVSDCISLYLIL